MTKNTTFTKTDMLREEEHIKEEVYSFYDKEIADLNTKVKEAKEAIDRDNYESQFKPIYASEHSKAFAKLQKARDEMLSMYEQPYFGHVGLKEENGDVLQCLLSENPDLDEFKRIKGADEETYLVPFKMDEKRKIFNALYHIWLVKNGDAVTVQDNSKQGETTYKPEVIREVTISSRNLIDADQFYPYAEFHEEIIDFDDLLAQRLDENRDSAQLRIIISTLQREQYDIVQTDLNKSMVVQGCAGSGKSQCLIHRLFYMRDALSSKGWDKVLLVTPTQLFRNYSAELMRRFHLSHVANTSI